MKRYMFFWLEKLKITPNERKAVAGLLIVLVALTVVNVGISQNEPFEENEYQRLEQQFRERTKMLQAKRKELMARYYPPSNTQPARVVSDTIPQDSIKKSPQDSQEDGSQQDKININTAGQAALETLPGIGPAYAKRIITYRKKHDGFKSIDELKKIKGIAQKRLDNLKPFVKLKDPK